jgi:succinoglycan biosynthesis transport protein ExoP
MNEPLRTPTLRDQLAMLRRRRWPMIWTGAAVLVAALLTALLWPPTYRSTGQILIEQQELPADLVRSTITSFADQRIQVISQRVMTTENLTRIIDRYDLYADQRRSRPREEIIERMRDDIHFEMISADVIDPNSGRATKATIAFSVSYDNRSPQVAARVANEIVSLYLEENIENRKQRSAEAANFLGEEGNRLSREIAEIQSRVATFKERNQDALPELGQINIQLMTRVDDEVADVDARIRSLDQQIVFLEAQLAQITPTSAVYTSTGERVLSAPDRLKYLEAEYARVAALYAPDHPDVTRLAREIEGLKAQVGATRRGNGDLRRQLEDARSSLASARERYGAAHPDVIQLEQLVAGLERSLAPAAAQAAADDVDADNPAYIQIRAQRQASLNERASLQGRRGELQRQLGDLRRRLQLAPQVEREYVGMMRDLEGAQAKYAEVRQKQMEAQVARNLEDERKGERFTLIEPPLASEKPARPNRPLIAGLGLALALALALGVALLLEALDDGVRDRSDLERLLTVPPLAVLPWIENAAERALRIRRLRMAAAGGVVATLALIVTVHFAFRPLDVLLQIALRRLTG